MVEKASQKCSSGVPCCSVDTFLILFAPPSNRQCHVQNRLVYVLETYKTTCHYCRYKHDIYKFHYGSQFQKINAIIICKVGRSCTKCTASLAPLTPCHELSCFYISSNLRPFNHNAFPLLNPFPKLSQTRHKVIISYVITAKKHTLLGSSIQNNTSSRFITVSIYLSDLK